MSNDFPSRVLMPLAIVWLCSPVAAQEIQHSAEVEARAAALEFISVTENRFDCNFAEYSIQKYADRSGTRYLVLVDVSGKECKDAQRHLENLGARKEKLLFQFRNSSSGPEQKTVILPGDQTLIHEINPGSEK